MEEQWQGKPVVELQCQHGRQEGHQRRSSRRLPGMSTPKPTFCRTLDSLPGPPRLLRDRHDIAIDTCLRTIQSFGTLQIYSQQALTPSSIELRACPKEPRYFGPPSTRFRTHLQLGVPWYHLVRIRQPGQGQRRLDPPRLWLDSQQPQR